MHILTANEMYEIDRFAMEEGGIDGRILIENAGRAIAAKILPLLTEGQQILILVGAGNNGGDGFVIGRTLINYGYDVTLLQLVPDGKIRGDAAYHKQVLLNYGGTVQVNDEGKQLSVYLSEADVVIDALLGIGIKGELKPPFRQIIQEINNADAMKISVDIPSGIPADEGISFDTGIQADFTFIVEQPKMSAFLQHTASYYGEWETVSIGLPKSVYSKGKTRRVWMERDIRKTLPYRDNYSHKGNHGRGLVVGGSFEMAGSIAMTARAALRAGSGLVTVATARDVIPSVSSNCIEATYLSLPCEDGRITGRITTDLSSYEGIAIGMGMGRDSKTAAFTKDLVEMAIQPVLIDADALYHIHNDLSVLERRTSPTVLTPHLGEMSLLTAIPVAEILLRPFSITKEFAQRYQVYLILKGPFTIITDPYGNQWVNTTGNAGLAKGGSGDVLSGIILTLMMQSNSIATALTNACFIHGKSAEYLVEKKHSKYDLLATDVIDGLASVFRALS